MLLFTARSYTQRLTGLLRFFCLSSALLVAVVVTDLVNRTVSAMEREHHSDVHLRLRYVLAESADINGKAASAAVQWQLNSRWSDTWSSIFELGHVSTLFNNQHNDGRESNDQPVIPDVASTEIKQLALSWSDSQNHIKAGRQQLTLDDQRFIGSNSYWQNDQTLDAMRYQRSLGFSSTFTYAYVHSAQRIFARDGDVIQTQDSDNNPYGLLPGEPTQLGQHDHSSHLLHLHWQDWDYQNLSLFYYDIDIKQLPQLDNQTWGARYEYERRWGKLKPSVIASYADQARSSTGQSANIPYYLLQFQVAAPSKAIAVRHEALGSRQGLGLVTPLADFHAFQGWADAFPAIADRGIEDTSVKLLWRHKPIKLDLRQHWFSRYDDGRFLGRETDLDIVLKINRQQHLLVRLAHLQASTTAKLNGITSEHRAFFDYRLHF